MDDVSVSRTPAVTFRSPRRDGSGDPYAGGGFVVELEAEGIHARRHVFMFTFDWPALGAFFTDLAESWRGWEGEKTWTSVEHDLQIVAVADSMGHCSLSFVVRDGAVATWRVQLDGVIVDGGEDLTNLAKEITSWASHGADEY